MQDESGITSMAWRMGGHEAACWAEVNGDRVCIIRIDVGRYLCVSTATGAVWERSQQQIQSTLEATATVYPVRVT